MLTNVVEFGRQLSERQTSWVTVNWAAK